MQRKRDPELEAEEAWAAYDAERAPILKAFGAKLAQLRPKKESQEALAERADLHRNEIGYLERGQREPGLLTLLILADTLGEQVTLNDLAEGLPAPKVRKPHGQRPKKPAKSAVKKGK